MWKSKCYLWKVRHWWSQIKICCSTKIVSFCRNILMYWNEFGMIFIYSIEKINTDDLFVDKSNIFFETTPVEWDNTNVLRNVFKNNFEILCNLSGLLKISSKIKRVIDFQFHIQINFLSKKYYNLFLTSIRSWKLYNFPNKSMLFIMHTIHTFLKKNLYNTIYNGT